MVKYDRLRLWLVSLPRRYKRLIQVAADVVLVWIALWMAFVVRLGIEEAINPFTTHLWIFVTAPLIAIPLFIRFGMYRAVMRYFGNDALVTIIKAVSLSSLILGVAVLLVQQPSSRDPPFDRVQLLVAESDHGWRLAPGHASVFSR